MTELADSIRRKSLLRKMDALKNLLNHLVTGSPNDSMSELIGEIKVKLAIVYNDLDMLQDRGIADTLDNMILTVLDRLPNWEEDRIWQMTLQLINRFLAEVIDSQTEHEENDLS